MTKIKKFQEGGVIDEDELFTDDPIDGAEPGAAPISITPENTLPGDPPEPDPAPDPDPDPLPPREELTGVEQFLTNFGVNGGVISYEDGTSARFSDLDATEQSTILSSLTADATPTIEDRYNLDDREVNLLNAIRDSKESPEAFINNIIDERVNVLMSQSEMSTLDYSNVSDDAIFVRNLRDNKDDITNDEIAEELVKAKELTSYVSTVDAIREMYKGKQVESNARINNDKNNAFNEELEAQRYSVVDAVGNINDIGGAPITTEMKEFLLHDIMELNENKDPILMENIFSSPEQMFKANWFVNYGEDYMKQMDAYWKKEVSKAHKAGYQQATGGMPGSPTIVSPNGKKIANPTPGDRPEFGKVLSEEELFDEKEK